MSAARPAPARRPRPARPARAPWRWAALLALLLAACGGPPATPTPTRDSGPLPIDPQPTQSSGPPATVVVEGAGLPGRLLFVRDGNLWLWQGERGSQLTDGGDALQPAWSPDGAQIVFVRRGESYSDLMLLPAAGGAPQPLTNNGSSLPLQSVERIYETLWAFYPTFAPGGDAIAFVSQAQPPTGVPPAEAPLALYAVTPRPGAEPRLLFVDASGNVGRPAYAPDGSAIVFSASSAGARGMLLMRYDLASESVVPLPGAPQQSYDPAFTPDGRFVAFAARDGEQTDLFAAPAGGGGVTRLTNLGAARAPAFSPDGRLLAFLAIAPGELAFDLWVAEVGESGGALQVGAPRRITSGLRIDPDSGLAWAG